MKIYAPLWKSRWYLRWCQNFEGDGLAVFCRRSVPSSPPKASCRIGDESVSRNSLPSVFFAPMSFLNFPTVQHQHLAHLLHNDLVVAKIPVPCPVRLKHPNLEICKAFFVRAGFKDSRFHFCIWFQFLYIFWSTRLNQPRSLTGFTSRSTVSRCGHSGNYTHHKPWAVGLPSLLRKRNMHKPWGSWHARNSPWTSLPLSTSHCTKLAAPMATMVEGFGMSAATRLRPTTLTCSLPHSTALPNNPCPPHIGQEPVLTSLANVSPTSSAMVQFPLTFLFLRTLPETAWNSTASPDRTDMCLHIA